MKGNGFKERQGLFWLGIAMVLLLPTALGQYTLDLNKTVIIPGMDSNSASYDSLTAAEQWAIGEASSANYSTCVGWICTLGDIKKVIMTVSLPVNDANMSSSPLTVFDINKNGASDVNTESIVIELNGTASTVFNAGTDCVEVGGAYRCSYTETGLTPDFDNNMAFRASNNIGEGSNQVEIIIHYDVSAPTITSASTNESGSNVIFSWTATDSLTGIESFYVRADGRNWIELNGDVSSYAFLGHADNNHTYGVKARDFVDLNSLITQASFITSAAGPPVTPPGTGPPGGGGGAPRPPIVPPVRGLFDIRIMRVDGPIEVGERFDFTYVVSNGTNVSDNAYIEYWLELNDRKDVTGSETVYLVSGEEREINDYLVLSEEMEGEYEFYIRLSREEQDSVLRTRASRIMLGAPIAVDLNIASLYAGKGQEPLSFTIGVGSNKDYTLPVLVHEKIFKGNKLVWEKKQTVTINVFQRFLEEVHGLGNGEFVLEVEASYGEEKKKAVFSFERKAEEEPIVELPEIPFLGFLLMVLPWFLLLLLLLALLYWIRKFLREREGRKEKPLGGRGSRIGKLLREGKKKWRKFWERKGKSRNGKGKKWRFAPKGFF